MMIKKIIICSMCFIFLCVMGVFAQREIPGGNPPDGMQGVQGAFPEGMKIPEGMGPIQGIPENTDGFFGGQKEQGPQENTNNTQIENEQPTDEKGENTNQPEGQAENGEMPQNRNGNQMMPPNMDFGARNMPGGFDANNTQSKTEPMTFTDFLKEYHTPVISVILLLGAFVFVKLYKQKNY